MPTLNDASFLTQTFKDAWREDCPRCAAPMARDLTGAYPHVCVSPLRDALGAGMLAWASVGALVLGAALLIMFLG